MLSLLYPSLAYEAFLSANWSAIELIASLLIIARLFEISGALERLALKIIEVAGGSAKASIFSLIILTWFTAAFIMNDTSIFIFTPLAIVLSRMLKTSKSRIVAYTAIAANIGSSFTPIGNPQNVIIWTHYGMGFLDFVYEIIPFSAIGLLLLLGFLTFTIKASKVSMRKYPPILLNRKVAYAALSLLILNVVFAELGMELYGLVLTLAMSAIVYGRKAVLTIDYFLIATFILMLVDFGLASEILSTLLTTVPLGSSLATYFSAILLSQIVSNVPATIILINHVELWKPLVLGVSVGGVGSAIGSLANIIAIRVSGISYREFHKNTIPYFATLTTITIPLLH